MKYKFLPAPKETSYKSGFKFPGPRDRVTINGKTGSGKTTFAMWLFGEAADFDRKPWIVVDYKQEDPIFDGLLKEKLAPQLKVGELPKKPGIYLVRPKVRTDQADMVEYLWAIYERGRIGLLLDEATMIPELRGEGNSGGPFQSILSQGRAKEIPAWVLSQRPVNVNNMVFTENNFYSAFKLRSEDDYKKIVKHIPSDSEGFSRVWASNVKLNDHWSRWYDDRQERSWILRPCPAPDVVLETIAYRVESAKEKETL